MSANRMPFAAAMALALSAFALAALPAKSPAQTVSGGTAFQAPAAAPPVDPSLPTVPGVVPVAPTSTATLDARGRAIAPPDAPKAVKQIISAGNQIAFKKYVYGGGHRRWRDTGYDCSGSVSYALRGAKLLKAPLASGDFINWGEAGPGTWVTLYTKSSHIYMVVAGLRFDTSGRSKNGSRWQLAPRSAKGYTIRHPIGL